ncbi:MAG TPA: diguanylate cyclase [Parachlamydiales bacterium]|nr:diguanylate cyclase [Parachlamydiales bacterium]
MNDIQVHSLPQGSFWQLVCRRRAAKFAFFLLTTIGVLALFGPFFSPHHPSDIQLAYKNSPPCADFWFGTDELGRDLFVRVCWGARISLFLGISATLIDAAAGILWAAIAAHLGGKIETCLMKICDILHSIPYLLLVMMLTLVRGPGLVTLLVAMTITGWIHMARIVRSHMLQVKQQEYILSAKALGASSLRIIFCYLIPNSLGPIITAMTFSIPGAIFTEAFLSFLGLGVQAPAASWGVMISEGIKAMSFYPWRLFFPAASITATTLAFHLLGHAMRPK